MTKQVSNNDFGEDGLIICEVCNECKGDIYEGETYYDIDDYILHPGCVISHFSLNAKTARTDNGQY